MKSKAPRDNPGLSKETMLSRKRQSTRSRAAPGVREKATWSGKRQEYDWPSYYRIVRECQPKAVIFGMGSCLRRVGTETGYGRETDWSVVPVPISSSGNQERGSISLYMMDNLGMEKRPRRLSLAEAFFEGSRTDGREDCLSMGRSYEEV